MDLKVDSPSGAISIVISLNDDEPARKCGSCSLCCRLLPVRSLQKKAGERCQHQRFGKGCSIYARRPRDCETWSCRWLADDETARLPRPDRAHYVIDVMPDFVQLTDNESGVVHEIPVLQVWADPAFPEVHRNPALRAFLARVAEEHGMAALIRWDSRKALTVFAPALSSDGEWHEMIGACQLDGGNWSGLAH